MTPRTMIVQTYVMQATQAVFGAALIALASKALQERRVLLASIDLFFAGLNAILFVRQANIRADIRRWLQRHQL
jgi:xanthine/uracil permease